MTPPAGAGRGYLRQPGIGGDTVVFSCEDDLWRVPASGGPASRLTVGATGASHPRLSADGERVAYVATEDGPTEVYVRAMAGGAPRRLTYDAARCLVLGWHPGTGEILVASAAGQPHDVGLRLFAVPPAGGPPRLLDHGAASAVAYGPHGGTVLGRSIADPARRKGYRGGAAGELWLQRNESAAFARLPLPAGNLADPCWVGARIYFLSDHEGIGNVYFCRPDGSGLARHSDHRDFYARALSSDGRRLTYQAGARLYLLDPAQGRAGPIDVALAGAGHQHVQRILPAADHLDGARLSADGTALLVVARGQAATLAHWSGPVRHCGEPEGVRHRLLGPLADAGADADGGRLVAVAGDDRADERLVVLPAGGGPATREIPLAGLGCVTELLAAPAGGQVAFTTNRQQLWAVDLAGADGGTDDDVDDVADEEHVPPVPRLLDGSPYDRIEDLAWSPDGRWLAYTYPDSARRTSIRVVDLRSDAVSAVTDPVLRDSCPAFDPAGRYLYFLGQRELVPEFDQVQSEVGFPYGGRPYLVTLRAHTASPFVPRPEAGASEDKDDNGDGTDGDGAVEIDVAGIDRRVVPFPLPDGRYADIVGMQDRVLLLSVPVAAPTPVDPAHPLEPAQGPVGTVTALELSTGDVCADYLGRVDEISTDHAGRTLLYRAGNRLRVLPGTASAEEAAEHDKTWAEPGRASGWIDLARVGVTVRPVAEWRQMVREAWRLQRESFWDAGAVGAQWEAAYARYAPLTELVATRAELSDLLWELQGELGTSHAYERGGDYRRPPAQAQGFLGVDWAPAEPGSWRIGRILRGDPWKPEATSPLHRPGTDARPGDLVLAVDGQRVGPDGPAALLVGRAGHEVELTLTGPDARPRRATVRAIPDESRARYLDWVAANRERVHGATDGRLGYLHVPDMYSRGYSDFVRGFLTELDRDGLVVDVRFNGGGHVSSLVLDRLARRRMGLEHGRWSGVAPYPVEAPAGPMVALVNEHTGSDGELFAHLFRARGLGLLVGRRTWGGTIATWPRHELADGTVTTQPEFRHVLAGVGGGLENCGVQPDIEVDIPPRQVVPDGGRQPWSIEDPQLDAAVDHLDGMITARWGASPRPWVAGAAARAAATHARGAGPPRRGR